MRIEKLHDLIAATPPGGRLGLTEREIRVIAARSGVDMDESVARVRAGFLFNGVRIVIIPERWKEFLLR